jgi:hypothetical protein
MSVPKPDKKEYWLKYGDTLMAAIVDTMPFVKGEVNWRRFFLMPTAHLRFRYQIERKHNVDGFDADRGWWVKEYPAEYCKLEDSSPNRQIWQLGVNWKGERVPEVFQHNEQELRDSLNSANITINLQTERIITLLELLEGTLKGDATINRTILSRLKEEKGIMGNTILSRGRAGEGFAEPPPGDSQQ